MEWYCVLYFIWMGLWCKTDSPCWLLSPWYIIMQSCSIDNLRFLLWFLEILCESAKGPYPREQLDSGQAVQWLCGPGWWIKDLQHWASASTKESVRKLWQRIHRRKTAGATGLKISNLSEAEIDEYLFTNRMKVWQALLIFITVELLDFMLTQFLWISSWVPQSHEC